MIDCLLKEDKPRFKLILEEKIKTLEDERNMETAFYQMNGLYHERDVADIEDDLELTKRVLKNIDELPECTSN